MGQSSFINRIRGRIVGAGGILLMVCFFFACGKDDLTATTMKLLGYVGEVKLTMNGQETSLREDMMLHNGNGGNRRRRYGYCRCDGGKGR